jgi:hypothetical protein
MPKVGMYESDAYTAGTMRRLKNIQNYGTEGQGPNSTPTGALQKREMKMATGSDSTGATPNSTAQGSLQKSTQARGQSMIGYPEMSAQVMDYGGIPHRPDPNMGGASQLTKKGTGTGY